MKHNYQSLASNFGDRRQVANSINMNVTARPRNGLVLQGGFNNTAKTNSHSCDVAAPVLTYNQTFVLTSDSWLRPTSVLQARFVKFSAQIGF